MVVLSICEALGYKFQHPNKFFSPLKNSKKVKFNIK
jgi:hypothetical protein